MSVFASKKEKQRKKWREASRRYKARHPEKVRESNRKARRKYYQKTSTERQAYWQKWYAENIKKMTKYTKQYYWSHLKEMRAREIAKRSPLKKFCEKCGTSDNLERHHPDYEKPMEYLTLCKSCHKRLHSELAIVGLQQ